MFVSLACFYDFFVTEMLGAPCWRYSDFWERSWSLKSPAWFDGCFFSFFDFEVNRTRGFYFPSAVASSKMPGGFLVSSGGVGQKVVFLLCVSSSLVVS
jgi:hypothetical protein